MYPYGYTLKVYIVQKTNHFDKWLKKLRDVKAKAKIAVRLKKIEQGNLGDHKSIGSGFSELRVAYGPGYRIYYRKKSNVIILLLNGGDKGSQKRDIAKAKEIWKEIEANNEN